MNVKYSDFGYWFTFLILFSNLLPISLYVTIETINVFQAFFVNQVGFCDVCARMCFK